MPPPPREEDNQPNTVLACKHLGTGTVVVVRLPPKPQNSVGGLIIKYPPPTPHQCIYVFSQEIGGLRTHSLNIPKSEAG